MCSFTQLADVERHHIAIAKSTQCLSSTPRRADPNTLTVMTEWVAESWPMVIRLMAALHSLLASWPFHPLHSCVCLWWRRYEGIEARVFVVLLLTSVLCNETRHLEMGLLRRERLSAPMGIWTSAVESTVERPSTNAIQRSFTSPHRLSHPASTPLAIRCQSLCLPPPSLHALRAPRSRRTV